MSEGDVQLRDERTGYDPVTRTYHVQYDRESSASINYTVIAAVSSVVGEEPQSIAPLSNSVDPDALNQLFTNNPIAGRPSDSVRFTIEGSDVTVQRDGHIIVHPPDHA